MGNLVVTTIVVLAFAYATWKFMPQALRQWIAAAIIGGCHLLGWKTSGAAVVAQRIIGNAQCGGCDSCGGCPGAGGKARFDKGPGRGQQL